ncbi:hypothetical protein FSI57_019405, partial [Escherichia coli]|nr:hypothetical protein [Escherichia coli]
MIAELTAAMTAIRETAQIAKLMNEAKTQAEVNAAIGELNSKLASIQRECVSLVELNRPGFPGECFICELRLP